MKTIFLIIAVIIATGLGYYFSPKLLCGVECQAKTNTNMQTSLISVNPHQFSQAAKQDQATIIDIRTAEEFSSGHLQAAVNHDFYQETDFKNYLASLDKDQPYLVYCRSGNRSGQTLEIMKQMGFTNVTDLDGGINAWQQAGLAIVK